MNQDLRSRIDSMYDRDKMMAWVFVVLLWLTIGFVYFAIDQFITSNTLRAVVAIGALLLVVFNTAAIYAMVKHYGEDKEHIYGLDIRHLDESRGN